MQAEDFGHYYRTCKGAPTERPKKNPRVKKSKSGERGSVEGQAEIPLTQSHPQGCIAA